ncbi:MAG: 7-cyano-7-deazaguanine synthase [Elusimicrobia bacterium]|nr:7-cyano-7-deazaguanine synthase [Elusimicrobiota bacterium]
MLKLSKTAVVLLSGGLDSSTLLYLAKKNGYKCRCLIFDYGQRHKKEIISAKLIAKSAGCNYQILKINFPWKGSSLLDKSENIPVNPVRDNGRFANKDDGITLPFNSMISIRRQESAAFSNGVNENPLKLKKIPSTYIPGRNTVFISFALSFAEKIRASAIFIGANAVDFSGYPDCRPQYFRAWQNLVHSLGLKIKVLTPLINLSKARIVKLGKKMDVPFGLTWSCYKGKKKPCGICDSCRFREKGFLAAHLEDPLMKR